MQRAVAVVEYDYGHLISAARWFSGFPEGFMRSFVFVGGDCRFK